MLKLNHTLLTFILMTCTVSLSMHGMKRAECTSENGILAANGESLPQDILEHIFTYVCDTSISVPLTQESAQQMIFELSLRYLNSPYSNNPWHIAPYGKVAQLVVLRSVCKQWYNLLNPAKIKHRLNINTDDIIADLDTIKVTGNRKNYSHAQFLAQMVKNQIKYDDKVCDHLVNNDQGKLEIFLENGLADSKYKNKLISERRYNKFIAMGRVLGVMFCLCCMYGFFYLLYENSCASGRWQTQDHPWKKFINESLCTLCSNVQKSHELHYPSRFVKDYFYTYYDGCNICNGTTFESQQALYAQCIEGFFESCQNQCGIFKEVYGRWIRMGIEKWSNG